MFPVMMTPAKEVKNVITKSISGTNSASSSRKMSVREERMRNQIQNMNSMRA